MILDDGGDVMFFIFLGVEVEKNFDLFFNLFNEEEEVFYVMIKRCNVENLGWYVKVCESIKGVMEEIIIGVLCFY